MTDYDRAAERVSTALRRLHYQLAAARVVAAAKRLAELLGKANFDPNQPRVPRGNPDGGQWTGEGGIGTPHPSGTTRPIRVAQAITGFRKHGINRVISRGVAPSAILDAVRNPIQVLPQPNGTTRYVGQDAVVVLNPAGEVVTVWRP